MTVQVMATIGEQFTEGDEICGVAVNIRQKGDRIEMWTRTSSNEAAQVGDGIASVMPCNVVCLPLFSCPTHVWENHNWYMHMCLWGVFLWSMQLGKYLCRAPTMHRFECLSRMI